MIGLLYMVALLIECYYGQQIPEELVGSFQGELQPTVEPMVLYPEDYEEPPSSCVRYRFHDNGVWETEWQVTPDNGEQVSRGSVCSKMQTNGGRWVQKPPEETSINGTIVNYDCDYSQSGKLYVQYKQYYICVLFSRMYDELQLAQGPPYFSSDYESASCPPYIEAYQDYGGTTDSSFRGVTCQQADQDLGICQVAPTFDEYAEFMSESSATCN